MGGIELENYFLAINGFPEYYLTRKIMHSRGILWHI